MATKTQRTTFKFTWKCLFSGVLFCYASICVAVNPIDSLKNILQNIDSSQNIAHWASIHKALGSAYQEDANYSEALLHYEKAFRALQQYNYKKNSHEIAIQIAEILYRQSKHELSLNYLKKVEQEIDTSNKQLLALAFRFIGINQVYTGDYAQAYKYQNQALNLFKELKDSLNISRLEYGIATNFFYQRQYEKSLEHYKNSLKISEHLGNKQMIYGSYASIGSLFEKQGKYREALESHFLALNIAQALNDKSNFGWTLFNIGSVQHKQREYNKAISTLQQAEKISAEMNDGGLKSEVWVAMADVYNSIENPTLALVYLQKSRDLATKDNIRSLLVDIYKYMAKSYFLKKDLNKYNEYIQKHLSLKDSLFNDNLTKEMAGLKQNFAIIQLEKDNEVNLLKKDNEIHRVKTNFNIGIAFAIFVIAALLLFLMYMRNKNQKEKNILLESKNKEITRQNQVLATSNRDLEQYAYIISHDLKEPLRNISSFTNLLNRKMKNSLTPDTQQYMDYILKGTQQMHDLLQDLLLYSKISRQTKDKKPIDVNIFIEEILEQLAPEIQKNEAQIDLSLLPTVVFDKQQLKIIFNQVLKNAIKFRRAENPIIKVSYTENVENYIFSIKDNGIGIDEKYYEKIFIIFQRIHDRSKYSGTSMGLATCKKILEENGGSIYVKSVLGEGSTFYLQIPKI